jgi:hypothetical protein
MCNALDQDGRQRHILSVVGHQRQSCYTPKKSWHSARSGQRRSQPYQRDQDGHPGA